MSLPVYPATYPMAGQPYGTPAAPARLATHQLPSAPSYAANPPAAPRPVIRAQAADEMSAVARPAPASPRLRTLSMPTPEQLGVTSAGVTSRESVDWTALHTRLNQLGATCFHVERLAEGTCCLTCLLPTDQQGHRHRIDAQGVCEAEAARLLLAKLSEWAAGKW